MYQVSLFLHNILRWIVIIAALFAFLKAIQSWIGKKEWSNSDKISGLIFTISLDVQILLGFLLYGISPIMKAAWSDFGAAMQNETLIFFAVEHLPLMVLLPYLRILGFVQGNQKMLTPIGSVQ